MLLADMVVKSYTHTIPGDPFSNSKINMLQVPEASCALILSLQFGFNRLTLIPQPSLETGSTSFIPKFFIDSGDKKEILVYLHFHFK